MLLDALGEAADDFNSWRIRQMHNLANVISRPTLAT